MSKTKKQCVFCHQESKEQNFVVSEKQLLGRRPEGAALHPVKGGLK